MLQFILSWDTSGEERFKAITAAYYRGSHGMFLPTLILQLILWKHAIAEEYNCDIVILCFLFVI